MTAMRTVSLPLSPEIQSIIRFSGFQQEKAWSTLPFHPCSIHFPSSSTEKSLWYSAFTFFFTYLTISWSSASCRNPALTFLACHCLYVSGLSSLSVPSHAMMLIASFANTSSSNSSRLGSSRGTVASYMSNSDENWNSASRNLVTKKGVL